MKERMVVVGAGGHAKVIIEILEESGDFEIAGCTSQCGAGDVLGIPVLGDDSILPALYREGLRHAFVAIGDNRTRIAVARKLVTAGFRLINAVSRRAVISPRAWLGSGVAVMPGAVINVLSRVNDGAIVNTGAIVDHDCSIGACSHVAPGAALAGCVSVGEGAFLGIGSRVIPGIAIGAWTTVGAGAVVIRTLPIGVTAVGVPAVIQRKEESCRPGLSR